ncbi:hypothetical protein [Phycicoccus endophyticus]|nr:hypothetical protein [Phycicoccus endophyticus]
MSVNATMTVSTSPLAVSTRSCSRVYGGGPPAWIELGMVLVLPVIR